MRLQFTIYVLVMVGFRGQIFSCLLLTKVVLNTTRALSPYVVLNKAILLE